MIAVLAFSTLALTTGQGPAKPFKATAKLGVPYTVGEDAFVIGSKKPIDIGTLRVLTVHSARLATTYPNLAENVSAAAGEKLFIFRGSVKNPSSMVAPISASGFLGIRFWEGRGAGEFRYVGSYDPQTRKLLHVNLKKGQSADFDCVVRVPASFTAFRVGFYHRSPKKIAWYDFNPGLPKIASAFSPDGLTVADRAKGAKNVALDFDIYKMKVLGISDVDQIGGMSKGSQRLCVVSVEVANAMLLPVRWGWQYVTAELVMKDGSVVLAAGDLIDKATDRTWSGDLAVDAAMVSQFIFRPPSGATPAAFRLTLLSSKRTVEVPL